MELGLVLTLCGLGGAFLAVGLVVTIMAAKKKRCCTASVWALVVEIRANRSGEDGQVSYHPLYEFEVNGVVYRRLGASISGKVPGVGEYVPVLYDPEKPSRSYIQGYDDTVYKILGIVFTAVGCVPILVCIGIALFA